MKPGSGKYRAATQVKVLSPVIFNIVEADAFHVVGRQHCQTVRRRGPDSSTGVLVRGTILYGRHVNLGDPLDSSQKGEYAVTSCKRQGTTDGPVEVGPTDSTQSTGKPCTWGSGRQWYNRLGFSQADTLRSDK